MTRIVKEYSERKNEIIDIAQKLFFQKGYDRTSIESIIEVVDIAKGTFYHYFKSKDDLLFQLTKKHAMIMEAKVKAIVGDRDLSALEKFKKVIDDIGSYKAENVETMILITKALYKAENIKLRHSLQDIIKISASSFAEIIKQGVSEGVFDTKYPEFVMDMIFNLVIYLRDEFAKIICSDSVKPEDYDDLYIKFEMYQDSVEKMLGVEKGNIKMFDKDMLNVFIKKMKK